MTSVQTSQLRIPEGINYECEGCGKCCSGWTVPMTQVDYERITTVDWGEVDSQYKGKTMFVPLKKYESAGTPYSYKISETGASGTCPFLRNNLCFIHGHKGATFKPAMCQLFPYRFNETPSGVYTTVSFVSMAVLYNKGKSLQEQQEYLEQKWKEFSNLYPDFHPDWSKIQLATERPMTWDQYLEYEAELLKLIKDTTIPMKERLLKGSEYLISKLGRSAPSASSTRLKPLDKHLLKTFHSMYFPARTLKRGEQDFNVPRFIYQSIFGSTKLTFPTKSFSIETLNEFPYPEGDPDLDELTDRYLFSSIYGKYYFGAGFGQISLVTGFHHLVMIYALIRLQARGLAKSRDASKVSMVDLIATIRQLDKHLGETKLDGYSAAAWELLLQSPGRARRFLANC
jgi:Fe-S-cluster containining protein